jgi:hypothetical protein
MPELLREARGLTVEQLKQLQNMARNMKKEG